jgi:S-formylglutathione hydrolase FrmB
MGNALTGVNVHELVAFRKEHEAFATLVLKRTEAPSEYRIAVRAIYFLQEQREGGRFQQAFEENREFAEELKARGATYDFDNLTGGDYDWDFWRAYLPDFLVFTS